MPTHKYLHPRSCITVVVLAMLVGCNTTPKAPEPQPRVTPPPQQQASPADRARMHTELAGGYYERAQMDIAIEELNVAVATEPGYAPAYNLYGLVYAVLGDDRKPLTPAVVREAWRVVVVAAWLTVGLCAVGIVGIHFLWASL